jgi:HEPN domain-containing protein
VLQAKSIQSWREEAVEAWIIAQKNLHMNFRSVFLVYAHLSLEKALKAQWIEERNEPPPRTHNLFFLVSDLTIKHSCTEEDIFFLQTMTPYAVEARYDSGSLFMKESVSDENIIWIQERMPSILQKFLPSIL